jgi:TRAP-type mannitol/chloroaromatic compound transport system substrate-binding protein
LFQALQRGTIDAVHSDDDSMASPTPLRQFGGYFPFATKHILDVPVLFNQYGLADIWREEYSKVGVSWISAAGQDPCNFNTKKEIKSLADLDGLKLYTFPTAGRFLSKFGVVPVSIPLRGCRSRGADRRARRHGLVRASPKTTRWAGPM